MLPNQWAKAGIEFSWLSLANFLQNFFFYAFLLFLPTQFGKHFWFSFSYVLGQRIDYLSPTVTLVDVFVLLLFFVTLPFVKVKIHPLFLLCVLTLGLSIFLSQNPFVGWYFFSRFLLLSFVVWFVASRRLNSFLAGLCLAIGVVFESILSFAQLLHQGSLGGFFYFLGERAFSSTTPGIANASIQGQLLLRPYGTFSHPNTLAGFLVVGMLLVLFFLGTKKNMFSKILFVATILVGTMGVLLSLSRTAIIVWILCVACLFFFKFFKRISKKFLLIAAFFESLLLLLLALFPPLLFRFLPSAYGESLIEREALAKSALQMIATHPLLGVGPNNFIPTLPSFSANSFFLQPVHSIYLLIGSETGMAGLFFFIGFLLFILLFFIESSRKNRRLAFPLFLAFIAILLIGLFDHYFITALQGQFVFAVVVGLLLQGAPQKADA